MPPTEKLNDIFVEIELVRSMMSGGNDTPAIDTWQSHDNGAVQHVNSTTPISYSYSSLFSFYRLLNESSSEWDPNDHIRILTAPVRVCAPRSGPFWFGPDQQCPQRLPGRSLKFL